MSFSDIYIEEYELDELLERFGHILNYNAYDLKTSKNRNVFMIILQTGLLRIAWNITKLTLATWWRQPAI